MRYMSWVGAILASSLLFTGCGSKGSGSGGSGSGGSSTYTIGGTISGLTGSGLVLATNGQTVTTTANSTSFTFPTAVASGTSYSVTVNTQPTGETCTVANGSGTVGTSNVTNVQVACTANTSSTYTIGGTISGLTAGGLTLATNGQTVSPASGAASFTFPTAVASGASYSVTVSTQPTGETCTVANGSGTVGTSNVTNIQVACTENTSSTYTIGGTISGLTAGGLVLEETVSNQTVSLLSGATSFTFTTTVASGASYSVMVSTQPTGETCSVANGSGTVGTSNVTNIQVACTENTSSQLTITTTTLSEGTVGTPYSQTINVSGGVSPYTFSISSGTLPSWASLNTGTGRITGTPTSSETGPTTFTVEVTDSDSHTATQQYTLTVYSVSGTNNSELNGHYAFLVKGWIDGVDQGSSTKSAVVGSFVADGNGNITSGEMNINNIESSGATPVSFTGTYALPSDNQGLMTLSVGSNTITLAFSAGDISSGISGGGTVIEFDDANGIGSTPGGSRVTGEFAMQTTSAFTAAGLTGAYAFGFEGETCPIYIYSGGPTPGANCSATDSPGPLDIAGTMTFSGSGGVSSGMEDIALDDGNCGGSGESSTCLVNFQQAAFTGSYGTPDGFGHATLSLTVPAASNPTAFPSADQEIWPTDYAIYMVNSSKAYVISTDSHVDYALIAGEADSSTVTSFSDSSVDGNAVLWVDQGNDSNDWGTSSYSQNATSIVGAFTSNGSGSFTSFTALFNNAGTVSTQSGTGSYSAASNGRITVNGLGSYPAYFYLYGTNAGFGVSTSGAPELFHLENQTSTTLDNGTLVCEAIGATPTAKQQTNVATLSTGSVSLVEAQASSQGVLTWDETDTSTFTVSSAGQMTVTDGPEGYVITPTRFALIQQAGSNTSPTVTVCHQ